MDDSPEAILNKLGIPFDSCEEIAHDDAMSSRVYRALHQQESPLILKFSHSPDRFRRETHFLSRLSGVIPVPKLVTTLDPQDNFAGAIVMEQSKGHLLNRATFTNNEAFQLGAILGTLHMQPAPWYGDLTLPKARHSAPLEAQEHLLAYFQESLDECKAILPAALLSRVVRYVHEGLYFLQEVEGPCIVHRDYRPGNAIADNGKITAIIDFENTKGSFSQEDFVLIEYLVWSKYPGTKPSFLEGYASIRPLPPLGELISYLCLIKAMGAIGFTAARGTWNTKHARIFQENLKYIEASLQTKR